MAAKTDLLALLSFVTLAALAACGGNSQPSPTPTPSAAATTGGTTTPTPVGVAGAIPLSLTDGVDLPDNLALILGEEHASGGGGLGSVGSAH